MMCTSFQAMLLFYALFSYVVSLHFQTGMGKFADVDHLLSTWEITARDISFTFKCTWHTFPLRIYQQRSVFHFALVLINSV